jgi:hypothetical protein
VGAGAAGTTFLEVFVGLSLGLSEVRWLGNWVSLAWPGRISGTLRRVPHAPGSKPAAQRFGLFWPLAG